MTPAFWPILVYAGAVIVLVGGMLGLSYLLGQRHAERQTGEPYEGGIVPASQGPPRVSPLYYVVAMLFVVFDLEAVFLIAWSVALRRAGWPGFVGALVFLAVLLVVLLYEARSGAFDYGLKGKDVLRRLEEIRRKQEAP